MKQIDNIFSALAESAGEEEILQILTRPGLRIERIVSTGQCSSPGFWYDQASGEWVVVLRGEALLRFEDEAAPRRLGPGDCVNIAPHRRHRVEWTDPAQPTVWLAVHYAP